MLFITSQNNNNEENVNNSNGIKFYILQNGALQNGAEISSSKSGGYTGLIPSYKGSNSNSSDETGISVYGSKVQTGGEQKVTVVVETDNKTIAENSLIDYYEKKGLKVTNVTSGEPQISEGKTVCVVTGYVNENESEVYSYGGSITISLENIQDFNFTKYKNIGFTVKEYRQAKAGALYLDKNFSRSNSGGRPGTQSSEKKQICAISGNGDYLKSLDGYELENFNCLQFTCSSTGMCYKITEIYLQE